MRIKTFLKLSHSRMYLNGHTLNDFNPYTDKRDFYRESIDEFSDAYNYQWMKREQLKAELLEVRRLYQGGVDEIVYFIFWRQIKIKIFKTYLVQFFILTLQKFL